MATTNAADYNSRSISGFKAVIITPDGSRHDVTLAVDNISITESIDTFHYYGAMTLFDTANLRETLPLVGQEKISIEFAKESIEYSTTLNITSIDDISTDQKITTLKMYLASDPELINSTKIFSRALSGRASNVIDTIHKEFFGSAIDEKDGSQNSINYIVPYLNPYEAITHILDKSHDVQFNPMYLYQTLADNKVKLKSLSSLLGQEPLYTFSDKPVISKPTEKPGYRSLIQETNFNRILGYSIKAFDIQSNIRHGVYGSFTTNYDLTSKSYNEYKYKYNSSKTQDYLNPSFKVGNDPVANITTSRHFVQRKNKLGFESLANLDSYTTEALANKLSLHNDMYSFRIDANINSRPGIMAGCVLEMTFDKDKPKLQGGDLQEAQVSGNYIVHTLTHRLSNESYSMDVVLLKDRIK